MSKTVTIGTKSLGKFRASWLLVKEAWRFLRADGELLLVPIVMTVLLLLISGVVLIGVLISGFVTVNQSSGGMITWHNALIILIFYVISAYILALSQAMVVHTVNTRARGGNATLMQSLVISLRHSPALLLWSLVAGSVGLILRTLSERSAAVGRIIAALLGGAWSVLTYFVVPAIVLDNKSAIAAIPYSGSVFKQTWGETLIVNITMGLTFLIMHIVAILLWVGTCAVAAYMSIPALFIVVTIFYIVWLIGSLLVQNTLNAIVLALLYLYATTKGEGLTNFNTELLAAILGKQRILDQQSSLSTNAVQTSDNLN